MRTRFTKCLISTLLPCVLSATAALSPAADAKPVDAKPSAAAKSAAATQPKAKDELRVAVLDFGADTPGSPELGKQIGEILVASLSGQDALTLVDRSALARVLQEQELNLS